MPRNKITGAQWAIARREYEAGRLNISQIAKMLCTKRDTVARHRDNPESPWMRPEKEALQSAAASSGESKIFDIATGRALDVLEADGGLARLSQGMCESVLSTVARMQKQASIDDKLLRFAEKVLDEANQLKFTPESAAVKKIAASIATDVLKVSRQVAGLKLGQGSLDATGGVGDGEAPAADAATPTPEEAALNPFKRFVFVVRPPDPPTPPRDEQQAV
jgi:hypothetical protein